MASGIERNINEEARDNRDSTKADTLILGSFATLSEKTHKHAFLDRDEHFHF